MTQAATRAFTKAKSKAAGITGASARKVAPMQHEPAAPNTRLLFSSPSSTTYSVNDAKDEIARTIEHIHDMRGRDHHTSSSEPVLYLAGAPGIGKTFIVRQAAEDHGYTLYTVIGASLLAEDVGGQPVVSHRDYDGEATPVITFALSVIIQEVLDLRERTGKPVVVFFDEASRIALDVQAPLLSFIQFRGLHGAYLPDDTILIMAGNREDDDGGGIPLLAPMINRVVVIDVQADAKEWVRWATNAGNQHFPTSLHPLIAATLLNWPSQKSPFNFDPANGAQPFGSPRSWEAVNEYITYQERAGKPCDVRRIGAMIGPQNAAILATQAAFLEKLTPTADVLSDPMGVPVHDDPTIACLQFMVLTRAIKNVAHVDAAIQYATRPSPKNAQSTVPAWTMFLGLFGDGLRRAVNGTPDAKDKNKFTGGIGDPAVHDSSRCMFVPFLRQYGIGGLGLMRTGKKLL